MKGNRPALVIASVSLATITGVWVYSGRSKPKPAITPLNAAAKELVRAVPQSAPQRAGLKLAIERHQSSKDRKVQDVVSRAKLTLAYGDARAGNFGKARAAFLSTATSYKGSGATSADFGSLPDQALYQAAVCLVAEGKVEEAKADFTKFLKDRPLSPLVHASHRRLARLNGGTATPAQDELLQAAIAKQEAHIRFETSVCGPKVIEYLLPKLEQKPMGYKELAKLFKTTDQGTTLEGMREGLKTLAIPSFAFEVNRRDFATLPLPAVWLRDDHYVALLSVNQGKARYYDPRRKSEETIELPPKNDHQFLAVVLTFEVPTFSEAPQP